MFPLVVKETEAQEVKYFVSVEKSISDLTAI